MAQDPTIKFRMERYNDRCANGGIRKTSLFVPNELWPWLAKACKQMRADHRDYGVSNLPEPPDKNPYVNYGESKRRQVRMPATAVEPIKNMLKDWRKK